MSARLLAYTGLGAVLFNAVSCQSASHKDRSSDSPTPTTDSYARDSATPDSAGDTGGDTGPAVSPGPWIALSCGQNDCCAIATDHKFVCWGSDDWGELDALPDTTVSQVSVSSPGICVLDESGAIECSPGYAGWPTPAGSFGAVVADGYAGCALDDEHVLDCWGGDFSVPPPAGLV